MAGMERVREPEPREEPLCSTATEQEGSADGSTVNEEVIELFEIWEEDQDEADSTEEMLSETEKAEAEKAKICVGGAWPRSARA